jgi:outer membrane protein assembly factor BamB
MVPILLLTLCVTAMAQPGPYSLWATPTSTRMSTPTVHGERVYAMPFFYEGGTIPFELSAWNASTGASLFTVPVSAWSNRTQDYRGLAPSVTRVGKHNAGRLVVVYAFHQSSSLKAVDGETGAFLWEQSLYTATCQDILHCEFVGLSSPSDGIFIVEQPSNLTRLDAATGEIVWTAMLTDNDGNPGSTRSHIAVDGDALIWSCRDRVHRVDLATGGFLWSSTIVLPNCSSPADGCYVMDFTPPVVDGKYIVVGGFADYWSVGINSPGVILSLWALTGTLRWSATPAYGMVSVAAGGGVAVANPGQYGGRQSDNASLHSYPCTSHFLCCFIWQLM